MTDLLQSEETFEACMNGFKYLDKDNLGYVDVKFFRYLMN